MKIPRKNWLEWSVFAVGLLCIGLVVGYLVRDAASEAGTPAQVVVRLGDAEQRGGRRYVPVTLVNSGGDAAAGVEVEVVLERGDRIVERARLLFDLVPREATREGWVAFDSAAAPGERIRTGGVAFGEP